MYECYTAKRFLRLLMLDVIIFSMFLTFFFIGKNIVFSAEDKKIDEKIFLPVIMYHSIHDGSSQEYVVTPKQAEEDLIYLKSNGYNAVSAEQIVNYVYNDGQLPEKPVLITLDDGFYNNLSYFLPLLEKYDMKAVVSVVGEFVENNAAADPHVSEYSYLTWDDVNELIDSGRVEIGNHTYAMHFNKNGRKGCSICNGESTEQYIDIFGKDTAALQTAMHENTGTTPFVFAYPFGYICKESIPVLKENGFLITLTCYERPNYLTRNTDCLYGLDRYNRSGNYTTEEFMSKALKEK